MDLIDFREEYCESPDWRQFIQPFHYYVPGRGAERPVAMVLGDFPGARDNLARKAFVGQDGRILDQLLEVAGLSPENAYLTHAFKYRPPAGWWITPAEARKAAKWVLKEWGVLGKPPVVITIGATPLACVSVNRIGLGFREVVGIPFKDRADWATVYPMDSLAYPILNPEVRDTVEARWEQLGEWIKEEGLL